MPLDPDDTLLVSRESKFRAVKASELSELALAAVTDRLDDLEQRLKRLEGRKKK